MTIESEIAGLTQATTSLLNAVNVRKTVLDEKVGNADAFAQASLTSANNAAASAAAANTKAGEAAGSAASALAIYGNTAAQQAAVTAAQNAASLAAGHAASASSVVQQDLSGVNAAALHRSPNAVTAMFVYDTSKDSDGGAWTDKCQHTSWWNEAINGKWLGAQDSELLARTVGATLGSQLVTNGSFDTDSAWTKGAGWSISGGVAVSVAPNSGNPELLQTIGMVAGKLYEVTLAVTRTAGSLHVRLGSGVQTLTITSSGTYRGVSVAGGSWLALLNAGGAFSGTIDNISVREVTALTTQSGDYFQSSADGKFYRLWKNLFSSTNDLTAASWSSSEVTASANGGDKSVISIVPSTNTATHKWGSNVTTDSHAAAFVVEAKANGYSKVALNEAAQSGYSSATVSLLDGSGGTASTIVTALADGWYRIEWRSGAMNNASKSWRVVVIPDAGVVNANSSSWAGDGTSGILVRNPHIEYGSAFTGYEQKTVADTTRTETFRGNKRDFPRLAAIVAEAASVTIYDLTEPGRPMWMRFIYGGGAYTQFFIGSSVTSIGIVNGLMCVGLNDDSYYRGHLMEARFISDKMLKRHSAYNQTSISHYGLKYRNTELAGFGYAGASATNIVINEVGQADGRTNAIAMTVLPDAPVDPVTGLQVPTIAVATGGGVSVIKHNGTVVNKNWAPAINYHIELKGTKVYTSGGSQTAYWGQQIWDFATDTTLLLGSNSPGIGLGRNDQFVNAVFAGNSSKLIGGYFLNNGVAIGNLNYASFGKSTVAGIAKGYATGHMVGDIRRTYLADIDAGMAGNDLVTNGSFLGVADGTAVTTLAGWSAYSTPTNRDIQGEKLRITATAGSQGASLTVTTVVGKRYVFSVTATGDLGAAGIYSDAIGDVSTVSGNVRVAFTATATSTVFFFRAANNAAGTTYYDNISVVEAVADRSYKAQSASINGTLTKSAVASAAQMVAYSGFSAANYLREPYSADMDFGTGEWGASAWVSIPTANAAAGIIVSRAHSSGAYIALGIDATNKLTATVSDGTTTRTVTTTAAYNNGTWLKARVNYTTDGSLAILVNGQEVAVTRGAPLLSLNNSNAVLTIGNSYAADAPFPGSIALLKLSATVPTPEQSVWMYEQEKQLFRDGAQCVLPDSGAIVDLTYDDATDKWIAVSATNESEWSGLVRTSVTAVPAGSYTKAAAASGVQLLARSTTSPGVDITIPAYGLREELVKRAESAARLNAQLATFDYVGGFTASTTTGSTSITSVAGLSYPVSAVGAQVTGAGLPAGTAITAVSGATAYLSKAATATGTAVQISFTDFILPVGYEAKAVMSAGTLKQEGSTKDFTRLFDGFKETIRFGVAPGYTAWVQIQATRSAT